MRLLNSIYLPRQAYVICKDMGMDTVELEEKWDRLDGYIDELPGLSNLFVKSLLKRQSQYQLIFLYNNYI